MPSILRMFQPLKSTAAGRALIKSENFQLNCLQRIDRATPQYITCYADVESFVRNIVVRALLPHREYSDAERIDFCQANIDEVNAAMLPILNMFLEYSRNPREFSRRMLEKLGVKTHEVNLPSPSGTANSIVLDAPIPGLKSNTVPKDWKKGEDYA